MVSFFQSFKEGDKTAEDDDNNNHDDNSDHGPGGLSWNNPHHNQSFDTRFMPCICKDGLPGVPSSSISLGGILLYFVFDWYFMRLKGHYSLMQLYRDMSLDHVLCAVFYWGQE